MLFNANGAVCLHIVRSLARRALQHLCVCPGGGPKACAVWVLLCLEEQGSAVTQWQRAARLKETPKTLLCPLDGDADECRSVVDWPNEHIKNATIATVSTRAIGTWRRSRGNELRDGATTASGATVGAIATDSSTWP